MKSTNFYGSDDFVVAISCDVESFEIKDGVRGKVCTFQVAASRFEFENLRSYPGRGFGAWNCWFWC